MRRFVGIFGLNAAPGNEDDGPGSPRSDRSATLYESDVADISGPEPCFVHEMELKFAEQKIHDLQLEKRQVEDQFKGALQQVKDLKGELDRLSQNFGPPQDSGEHKQSSQTILAQEKTIKKMKQELADKTKSQVKSEADIAQLQATCSDRDLIINKQNVDMENARMRIKRYYPKSRYFPELFMRQTPLNESDTMRRSTEQLSTTNTVLQKVNAEQLSTIQKLRSRIRELEASQSERIDQPFRSRMENLRKTTVEQLSTIQQLRNRIHELEVQHSTMPQDQANSTSEEDLKKIWELKRLHQQQLAELKSDMKELKSELKSARDDRDWHRSQHTRILDQRSLSELENPTIMNLEGQLKGARAEIAELKRGGPDVMSLQTQIRKAKAQILALKKRVAKVITEFDLIDSDNDVWRCDHQHGFARIDTETRFTRVMLTNSEDVINQAIKGFFHDQQFKNEYVKARKYHVQHALMHERNGHGTVMRAKDLDVTFTQADETRSLPRYQYLVY